MQLFAKFLFSLMLLTSVSCMGPLASKSDSEGGKKSIDKKRVKADTATTLAIDGGASIDIPKGALPEGSEVAVREVTKPGEFGSDGVIGASDSYEVLANGPDGNRLSKLDAPMTIAIPYSGTASLLAVASETENLCGFIKTSSGDLFSWRFADLLVNEEDNSIKLSTEHFGTFQITFCGETKLSKFKEAISEGIGVTLEPSGKYKSGEEIKEEIASKKEEESDDEEENNNEENPDDNPEGNSGDEVSYWFELPQRDGVMVDGDTQVGLMRFDVHNGETPECSRDNGGSWGPCNTGDEFWWGEDEYNSTLRFRAGSFERSFTPSSEHPGLVTITCTENVTTNETLTTFGARIDNNNEVICIDDGVEISENLPGGVYVSYDDVTIIARGDSYAVIKNTGSGGIFDAANINRFKIIGVDLESDINTWAANSLARFYNCVDCGVYGSHIEGDVASAGLVGCEGTTTLELKSLDIHVKTSGGDYAIKSFNGCDVTRLWHTYINSNATSNPAVRIHNASISDMDASHINSLGLALSVYSDSASAYTFSGQNNKFEGREMGPSSSVLRFYTVSAGTGIATLSNSEIYSFDGATSSGGALFVDGNTHLINLNGNSFYRVDAGGVDGPAIKVINEAGNSSMLQSSSVNHFCVENSGGRVFSQILDVTTAQSNFNVANQDGGANAQCDTNTWFPSP